MITIIPIKLTIEINNSKIEYSFNAIINIPNNEKEILDCVIIDDKESDINE